MTTDELLAECESLLRTGESITLSTYKTTVRPERKWCVRMLGTGQSSADYSAPIPSKALQGLLDWLRLRL
jgi:hypothetical protein